jgi:hypothetical protein
LRRGGPGSCPVLPRAPGRGLRGARLAAAPDLPPRLAARLPRRGNWAGAAASRWPPGSGLAGIPGSLDEGGSCMADLPSRPGRSLPPAGDVMPGDVSGALAACTAGRPLP